MAVREAPATRRRHKAPAPLNGRPAGRSQSTGAAHDHAAFGRGAGSERVAKAYGCMRHIRVPHPCGAASACANRLSCRFVSLHAGVRCEAHEREVRERLCRYIARPAAAVKRLTVNAQGKVVYLLKTPYRDGTTHVVFEPRDFIGVETVDPINPYFRSWPTPDMRLRPLGRGARGA